MLFPSADKRAKKDKHKVGEKGFYSDASSDEDGYIDSREVDYLSGSSSSSEGKAF